LDKQETVFTVLFIAVYALIILIGIGGGIAYLIKDKATKVQRVEGFCFGGTFIDGKCKAGSMSPVQPLQSERKSIRSSLETARMDRKASRSDGIRQPGASRKAAASKAVQESRLPEQRRGSYLLCAVSRGESAGDDGDKSLQALFPQDVEAVEAASTIRCRQYIIADNDESR